MRANFSAVCVSVPTSSAAHRVGRLLKENISVSVRDNLFREANRRCSTGSAVRAG
jgi:hypothetical protein